MVKCHVFIFFTINFAPSRQTSCPQFRWSDDGWHQLDARSQISNEVVCNWRMPAMSTSSCDRLILSMKLRDHREYNSTLNVIHFIAYHHVVTLALWLLRDLGIFATLNCEANPLCKEIPTLTTPFN